MCICHRPFLDGSSEANFLEDLAKDELQLNMALWSSAWILMQPSCKGISYQKRLIIKSNVSQVFPGWKLRGKLPGRSG